MRLVHERSSFPRLLVFPVAVSMAFGLFLSLTRDELLHQAAHCRLRDLTGFPCPTCGSTNAAVSMARGDWPGAFAANPVIALVLVMTVLWVVWGSAATVWPRLRRQVELSKGEKRGVRIAVGTTILLGWAYRLS